MANEVPEKESRFVKIFRTFGDIAALNALWLVFSIPMVTIGASTTALYSVTMKILENREGGIWKNFISAFKSNFKKATLAWVIVLFGCLLTWSSFTLSSGVEGVISSFYFVWGCIEVGVLALVLPFLFPMIARYDNTVFNYFKNAVLLSLSNFGACIKILLAWFMPIYFSTVPLIFVYTWYLWLIIVVGLIAYGSSFTLRRVFRRIEETQTNLVAKEETKPQPVAPKGLVERATVRKGLAQKAVVSKIEETELDDDATESIKETNV